MLILFLRRVVGAIPTILLISVFVFALQKLLPGDPVISRDNLDSMKTDNVIEKKAGVLTAEALGIKLTPLEAAAPHYLATPRGLDDYREHAGR